MLCLAVIAAHLLTIHALPPYALVIDAGSSHSSLAVYKLDNSTEYGVTQIGLLSQDEREGIHTFKDKPVQAGRSLQSLINQARRKVPKTFWEDTPLWLKATGGMRTLNITLVGPLFGNITAYLKKKANCPFKFMSASIISGDEEALFAYLGLNQLLGWRVPPVGILDLGGSTTQMAFKPTGFIRQGRATFYTGHTRSEAYVSSYMRFGMDEGLSRAKAYIVALFSPVGGDVGFSDILDFPCYPSGFEETEEFNGRTITWRGTSNINECSSLTWKIMNTDANCILEPCAMGGRTVEPVEGDYFATSGFYYTASGLGLVDGELTNITLESFEPAAWSQCAKSWSNITSSSIYKKGGAYKKFAHINCFHGAYAASILHAYHFPKDKPLTFASEFHGNSIDWTRGALLYEVLYEPFSLSRDAPPCSAQVVAAPVELGSFQIGAPRSAVIFEAPTIISLAIGAILGASVNRMFAARGTMPHGISHPALSPLLK